MPPTGSATDLRPAPAKRQPLGAPPHGLGPGDVRRLVTALLVGTGAVVGLALAFDHGLLAVGLVGACCLAWARFVEPMRLTVTRVRIESRKRASGSRPLRIVHVTDLQCDPRPRLEEVLPDAIAAERPDLVVFTGDAVNSEGGVPVFRRCLTRIAAIAPTFAVSGNWEVWNVPGADPFGGTGATLLDGSAARVAIPGVGDVWVAGVAADRGGEGGAALADVPPGALTLFLHHYPYPEVVPEADRPRVDLMLAGHVHGGQVALPFFGAILTLNRHGKRYEQGLHRVGPMRLFVSRGVGMEGRVVRLRFFAPPEIAVIEIAPGP